nr:hypothetical protein [Candidatus Sigynarchaeota archaeon]
MAIAIAIAFFCIVRVTFYTGVFIGTKKKMAVIKISNKKLVDDLQARLILRLGRKISQQETLDLCLEYANSKFDDILRIASSMPVLTPEIAERFI